MSTQKKKKKKRRNIKKGTQGLIIVQTFDSKLYALFFTSFNLSNSENA